RGQAVLPGPRSHGKPARPGGGRAPDARDGLRRARGGTRHGGALAGARRVTLGADKGYDTREFVASLRGLQVTPHVAQNTANRSSAIGGRTTSPPGYVVSQQKRKLVEEIFGWLRTTGMLRKTRHRGTERVGWIFVFGGAGYNLIRIRNLGAQPTWASRQAHVTPRPFGGVSLETGAGQQRLHRRCP